MSKPSARTRHERPVFAWINQAPVGSLQEVADLWSFQYEADWLANPEGFSLSPHLRLTIQYIQDDAS